MQSEEGRDRAEVVSDGGVQQEKATMAAMNRHGIQRDQAAESHGWFSWRRSGTVREQAELRG
jgi:hypothetical protein